LIQSDSFHEQTRSHRGPRDEGCCSGHLSVARICGGRQACVLRGGRQRRVSQSRRLCGTSSSGRETRGLAGHSAHQVRIGDQSQDCAVDRVEHFGLVSAACRRSHDQSAPVSSHNAPFASYKTPRVHFPCPGRSTARSDSAVVRCRPGPLRAPSLERSRISGAPLPLRSALHRIRDTSPQTAGVHHVARRCSGRGARSSRQAMLQSRRKLTFYTGYSEANRAPTPLELGCANPAKPCLLEHFLVSRRHFGTASIQAGRDRRGGHEVFGTHGCFVSRFRGD
jgi:hypothetical protein